MSQTPTAATLSRSTLLRDLPQQDLAAIALSARRRSFRRGEIIFHQGDNGDALYVLESGRVKVVVYANNGTETLLSVLGPGDCFGELALLDGAPRSATVQTLDAVDSVVVRRDEFLALLHSNPQTTERVLAALAAKIRYLSDLASDLAFLDVEGRVAKILLELAAEHGQEVDGVITIEASLTQEELGSMVGATRASINRVLGWYEDQRMIRRRGRHIAITDVVRLKARLG